MGRKIYNFFKFYKTKAKEAKKERIADTVKNARLNLIANKRAEENAVKQRNIKTRERMLGTEGTKRYNRMYDNKKQACGGCNSFSKRRHMNKYESIMGEARWACKSCVSKCPSCNNSCIDRETQDQDGKCFDCYSWGVCDSRWNIDKNSVLDEAVAGDKEACAILFNSAPLVKQGRFVGERISHVPTLEMDIIVRHGHPEFKDLASVIKTCRKFI